MADALLLGATLAAIYFAFALLALCMRTCRIEVLGNDRVRERPLSRMRTLLARSAAGVLFGLALVLAVAGNGPGFGPAVWLGLLSIGGVGVTATLTWRPSWLRCLANWL
jgi:hypothetical protein